MKRSILLAVVLLLGTQNLWATPKADSLRAFTGAPRAKFVWPRDTWADLHYKGLSTIQHALLLFDTDEGVERTLVDGIASVMYIRISRSGKWVTWNDISNANYVTYIMDLTSPTATKRVLLQKSSCTYWCVRALAADQATGAEYCYCLDDYVPANSNGGGIYKVPLNADGTADVSHATKLTVQGTARVDDAISVSSDAKKLGGAFPWPTTMILDIATGRLDQRHNGNFGCQANLAPDNSYRFFHCDDDHFGVNMWDANMSTTWWHVDLNVGVPGVPAGTQTDFAAPRWTNQLQFFTVCYPLLMSYNDPPDDSPAITSLAGMDSAAVVKLKKYWIPSNIIGRFSADFKSVAQYMTIAGNDIRHKDSNGDAWLSNGVTTQATAVRSSDKREIASSLSIARTGDLLTVGAKNGARATARLTDAHGRCVRQLTGAESVAVDTRGLGAGVYLLSAAAGGEKIAQRLTLAR